jgi:succinate-semialdehyde dehydrogenase/glutarate-semialdehyde dehydrogenase
VRTGGERIGNKGYFYQPTVVTGVGRDARMMYEEPFAPVAMIAPFREFDEVVEEANRLPYGLAPTPSLARPRRRTPSPTRSRAG